MKMQFDAVIIGGGASGLMCAVAAKLKNSKLNIAPADIFILINEPPLENWGMAGVQKG